MIKKEFDLDDVFLMSEIIDKMGLETDIQAITKTIQAKKLENKNDAMKLGKEVAVGIGIDVITKMIRNLFKAKNEVKQLIANLTGLDNKEVGKMGLKQIKEFFSELFQVDGAVDFLSQAGELTEKN